MESVRKYMTENHIIKDEIYNSVENKIFCIICLDVLIDPVMCMNCKGVYCYHCIKKWSKIDNKCPSRCQNPNYQNSSQTCQLLSKIKFECSDCKKNINYGEMEKHCISYCKLGNDNIEKKFEKLEETEGNVEEAKTKLKIITLGISGVGKTSLIQNFVNGEKLGPQLTTIGIEYNPKKYRLSDGSIIDCAILDTNGTERFKSINETYFRQADGCIIVYDITNENSFEQIKDYYIPKLREKCKENITTILLGNKSDKENERKITLEQGSQLALENNFIFKEISCTEMNNISNAFETIIEVTTIDMKNRGDDDNVTITINKKNHRKRIIKKGKKCC